ncbi:MAG: hypothetical protein COY68_03305 [Candidatus Levybacteria bacterium CG_4_10_14_0_8_um_filter_35_23]|nr:MAG: hypothetical protein COY68_03305 [Candidatus Levybacteria bacterium CG_4_10_14_0_8_um_filter_35_23]
MLTKNDLNQIRSVVKEEVKNEVADQVKMGLEPIAKDLSDVKKDLSDVKKDLSNVKKDLSNVKKDLKDVKKRVKKIEKTVDVVIDHFDREIVGTQKRVGKIEDHLSL